MRVMAAPGTKCPQEGRPRKYIMDAEPVDVPDSAYYKRLVADGSLLTAPAGSPKKKEAKADGK